MARFLVTGGCGFIGSHLVDSLVDEGNTVVVLDNLSSGKLENLNSKATLLRGDIEDSQKVAAAMEGVDGCFHLAAIASVSRSIEDWVGTHRTNLTGTINIFNAARSGKPGTPIPVVYASSAAVYGDVAEMPIAESLPTCPLTAYGADKLGCELHARVAWSQFGVPTTGLRFFNVYGPRQDPASPYSGVISIFADRLIADKPIMIHGDGLQTRDFVFVSDVVAHLRASMKTGTDGTRVFNVCTGVATTIIQLADGLAAAIGKHRHGAHQASRAGDIRHSVGSAALAIAALETRSVVHISAGLKRLTNYMIR